VNKPIDKKKTIIPKPGKQKNSYQIEQNLSNTSIPKFL